MAPPPGAVIVTGFVGPTDIADPYACQSEEWGRGGYRTVANAAARLAITPERRKEGMLVKQLDTGEIWTLTGGILDVNWVLDPLGVADSLRKLVNCGSVFFVDCDAGVDAAGRGTHILPLKTIQYAINNYVINRNNDLLVCWASAGGTFDENVNPTGVVVNKSYLVIVGFGNPQIDNTHGAASSVFYLSSAQGAIRVMGFYVYPTNPIEGVHDHIGYNIVGDPAFPMIYESCSVDVFIHGNAWQSTFQNSFHSFSTIGYQHEGHECIIKDAVMTSGGGVGTIAIAITDNAAQNNYFENIKAAGYETVMDVVAGATGNVFNKIRHSGATTVINDANAPGLNTYTDIQGPSQIGPNYTLTQDLKAIYDAALSSSSGGSIGGAYFVDTDAGVDAAGRGTHALPLKTIQYAINNYVTDYNNDLVICWASAAGIFDENVNPDGLLINKSSVIVMGLGGVRIQNTNGGATDIVHANFTSGVKVFGFTLMGVGGIRGIRVSGSSWATVGSEDMPLYVNSCSIGIYIENGSAYNTVSYNHLSECPLGIVLKDGTRNYAYENTIISTLAAGSHGIKGDAQGQSFIYKNHVSYAETGIGLVNACAIVSVSDNNIQGCTIPEADSAAAGINFWENNHILNPWVISGMDSQLTVVNGTNAITIATPTNPIPHARFKNVTVIINGAYAGGGNDSFKAHGAAGSSLTVWIEIQTPLDANWRIMTPLTDNYRLYQNNGHDCLVIDGITASTMFRIRAALSAAPSDTIDLDWQILIDTSG